MKKIFIPVFVGFVAMTFLTGCVIGSSRITEAKPTVGQQLVDLQKAKNTGAISDAEYQTEKAKLLDEKP